MPSPPNANGSHASAELGAGQAAEQSPGESASGAGALGDDPPALVERVAAWQRTGGGVPAA
eukprot:544720-Pyramimonas_sp.AAC.1